MRRRLIQRRFTRISARRIRLRSGLMLRITVELVPFGDETQAREIAVASIGNVGGSADLGDYAYTLSAEASPLAPAVGHNGIIRSEEHTSELQSLMRTSYAGFCLKKKKTTALRCKQCI